MTRRPSWLLLAALCAAPVLATPIPASLQITASVSIDTGNSQARTGSATEAGTLSLTAGAVAVAPIGFINDPTTMSPSALSSALSETGDGIGALLSMSGQATGGTNTAGPIFADYLFSLSNTSVGATYVVTFRALASNAVLATGDDAFAHSQLSVLDASLMELFFTDFFADTVNAGNNFEVASALNTFSLTLAPGDSTTLTALQRQEGGIFGAGAFSAQLDAFLSLDTIECRGDCGDPQPAVPLPGSLPLAALALVTLLAASRRNPR